MPSYQPTPEDFLASLEGVVLWATKARDEAQYALTLKSNEDRSRYLTRAYQLLIDTKDMCRQAWLTSGQPTVSDKFTNRWPDGTPIYFPKQPFDN